MQLFTQLTYEKIVFSAFYYISSPQHLQAYLVTILPILNTERVLIRAPVHWQALVLASLTSPTWGFHTPPFLWAQEHYLNPAQGKESLSSLSWCWFLFLSQPWILVTWTPGLAWPWAWWVVVMMLIWLSFVVCGFALLMCCGQRALTVGDNALPCQLCPHHLLSHVTSPEEQPELTAACQPQQGLLPKSSVVMKISGPCYNMGH